MSLRRLVFRTNNTHPICSKVLVERYIRIYHVYSKESYNVLQYPELEQL
jgi:hypothetical protein